MGLASQQSEPTSSPTERHPDNPDGDLTNGALDTLSSLIRVLGIESFPLDNHSDPNHFSIVCSDLARHVENGAAVPDFDIEPESGGKREWETVQRFLVDRRRNEKKFVTERLGDYREIVNELVSGLREIGQREKTAEANILDSLQLLQEAIGNDELPRIKTALAKTIAQVREVFAEQKQRYESELKGLHDRMSSLRQDLVAAREEMKQDALTQAYNRGAFDSALTHSVNMHYLTGQPVSLIMIDLDEFKQVNDRYGHSVGDAVLRAMGEALARSFIRRNDLVARYGGDEFAVILPDTRVKHVFTLAERLLNLVRDIEIEADGEIINISCSVGFTEAVEGDTETTLIDRADKALFKAKANGRDQSVCG